MAASAAAWTARAAFNGVDDLLIAIGVAVLIGAALWTYAIEQTRRKFVGTPDLWNGLVSYRRTDLERAHIATLRVTRAPIRRLVGADIAVGRMALRADGLSWRPNRWWSLGLPLARGSIQVPWSDVADVSVTDAPGKVSSLGGVLAVRRTDGPELSGEFLGSQDALREALAKVR